MHRFAAMIAIGTLLAACANMSGMVPGNRAETASQQITLASQIANESQPKVKFFGIPTLFSWPEHIAVGPDGNLWFTEYYAKQVARITTAGVVTEFPLPYGDDVESIVAGPDGNLWITEPGANQIGRITTRGVLTDFKIPAVNPDPRGITVGSDGNLWFTESNDGKIGRITTSGVITRFASGGSPWDIVTGADGNLWVTGSTSSHIVRFNPRSKTFLAPIRVTGTNPWALTLGRDRHIWFTGLAGGKIGLVVDGEATNFTIPTRGSYPDDIVAGPNGDLWFTETLKYGIGRFDPVTRTFPPRIVLSTMDIPTGIVGGPAKPK